MDTINVETINYLYIVNKKYINFYSINQWQLVVYRHNVHAKLSTILGTKYKDFQHQYVFFFARTLF